MNYKECSEYINKYELNNDFTKSIEHQFKRTQKISPKQLEALQKLAGDHSRIRLHFDANPPRDNFEKSLKTFFEDKGFLTPSQQKFLKVEDLNKWVFPKAQMCYD